MSEAPQRLFGVRLAALGGTTYSHDVDPLCAVTLIRIFVATDVARWFSVGLAKVDADGEATPIWHGRVAAELFDPWKPTGLEQLDVSIAVGERVRICAENLHHEALDFRAVLIGEVCFAG